MKEKNMKKRIVSLLLMAVTVFSSIFCFGSSAEAATTATVNAWDTPTSTKYAIVYTVSTSGKTIPYTTSSLSTRGTITYGKSSSAWISNSTDELYLLDAGITGGKAWAKVSYPIGSNKRAQAYIPLSAISSASYGKQHTFYRSSTGKFNVSLRKGGSKQSSHYVAKGDSVYVLDIASTKGTNVQIMYTISGNKWRIGYCTYDDVRTYLDGVSTTVNPTGVTISKSAVTLTGTGSTYTLTANAAPANATNKSVTWSTSNSKVATVNTSGKVTATGIGTAVITVKTSNGKTAKCTVTVKQLVVNPTGVSLSKTSASLYGKGETISLVATVSPSNATNKSVTWSTSNSKIATVSSSGVVTAVAAGTANITAKTSNGKTAVFKVTVTIPQATQTAQLVSTSEISSAAAKYGISKNSNAYKALESINTKYYSKLASSKNGTLIFFFEGVGSNSSANKRMNAMVVVVKSGKIEFIDKNSSTIPDYPFNPAKNGGDPMPTLKSGIYNFTTRNHQGKYAALNVTNAQVVRFKSKSSFYSSTSTAINIHRRSSDSIISSGTPNSAGCLLVGVKPNTSSKTSAYAKFIQSVGIVKSNGTAASKYQYQVTGKVIIDRSYSNSYLRSVGYSSSAISLIG